MSMFDAVFKLYTSLPKPNKPILPNTTPPYGEGPNRSTNLNAEGLIKTLLSGKFPEGQLIDHIDVWGEGRRDDDNTLTGFANSLNINLPQGITTPGATQGYPIPNLLPVTSFTDTFDLIPSGSVRYVTIMGSPIAPEIAKEMGRILYDDGMIICFGYKSGDPQIENLTAALGSGFIQFNHFQPVNQFARINTGAGVAFVKRGPRIASWEDGFQTNSKLSNSVDGKNVVNLVEGDYVVSWDDGYLSCKVGGKVDGTNVVILQDGGKVASWQDCFQSCAQGGVVDGKNVVILPRGGRVVSWNDCYQTCDPDSRVDGTNVVILRPGQSVVSWDNGYKSCTQNSIIDGSNVIIKSEGQKVLKRSDGTWVPIEEGEVIDNSSIILGWRVWNSYEWRVFKASGSSQTEVYSDYYTAHDEL